MNDNLEKLADKAGFIRFTREEKPNMPIDWSNDYTDELEKFAELVITECLEIMHGQFRAHRFDESVHLGLGDIRMTIGMEEELKQTAKKHFGLKC